VIWVPCFTGTLRGPDRGPMSVTIEDKFIRKFILGTWYKIWMSEVVIKRQHNNILICGVVCPLPTVKTMYFLTGYTETLLTELLGCNVSVEVQCVANDKAVIYKYV